VSAADLVRDTEATALALKLAFEGCNPVQVAGALQRRLGMTAAEAVKLCNSIEHDLAAADLDGQCSLYEAVHAMARGLTEDSKGIQALLRALEARCGWQLDAERRKALAEGSKRRWSTLKLVEKAG
jgi:hypothetical protein